MDYSQYKQLEFRRKFWKIMGAEIKMTQPNSENVIGFIKMKAWKLKEDIRLYSDQTATHELLRIGARNVIDFGATYDVFDSPSNNLLYSLRRKGLKSTFVRDHYEIKDASGNDMGYIQETSGMLALMRRWIELVPFGDIAGLIFAFTTQTYRINVGGQDVAMITHRKNPFIVKMSLDSSMAPANYDPRLGVAIASLLSIVDSVKNN